MRPIHTFNVIPALPVALEPLRKIAYNLRWSWDHEAIELFRRLDSDLWETCEHNPVHMLGLVDQRRLKEAAGNEAFVAHLNRVAEDLNHYLAHETSWCRRTHSCASACTVAYFSAEFGLTECLSIFAGGLGILAGDHMKSASDLGIPLVGVGLLYQQGYFRQYLNESGWQQESVKDNDFHNLPLTPVFKQDGSPQTVTMAYPGRDVVARIWRVDVGRVPLFLLDTNIPENQQAEDRDITDQLYGGDSEMRLKQEVLLGIGGYRALLAMGINPGVCHMNEGHSAFLSLERTRHLMQTMNLSFAEARLLAAVGMVFTTHTPVLAGHDRFQATLLERYFSPYLDKLGISLQELLALGRQNPSDPGEPFCMTVLAMRMSSYRNGVSRLHGAVSRGMWRGLWPGVPDSEIPIRHVTNGVHFRSWISAEMNQLYDRYLGPDWREEPSDRGLWKRAETIPAEELWRTHTRRRERLVAFARRRLAMQLRARGAPQAEIDAAEEALDPDALTIGFARRFATYKRATLLLRDPERLDHILNNHDRPVQIIFAGKAHPQDNDGKEFIRQVISLARWKEFRRRILFLEEYNMDVSRYLVQGCDVWLNTPTRPLEASGTSGMKAAANATLNLSVLDGWWDEAWRDSDSRLIGWAIGRGEAYANPGDQDPMDAAALYDLLERDVVPTFYERGADRVPRRWVERMKASLGTLCHNFNTHRMVREYTEAFYLPAHKRFEDLAAADAARARALAVWVDRVRRAWPEVRVLSVDNHSPESMAVGSPLQASVQVHLGSLTPEDVAVELYHGRLDADGGILNPAVTPMRHRGKLEAGNWAFEAQPVACQDSGRHGYTVRVRPAHVDLPDGQLPGLICWA
jgi:starch phosphorylase